MVEVSENTSTVPNELPAVVGRAAIAWNTSQHGIYMMFEILSGMDTESAKDVYFAVKSDRNQRDMVMKLIDHKLKSKNPHLAARARSAIGKVDALSARRNETLHVIYEDSLDDTKAKIFHDVGHLKGKVGEYLLAEIHKTTMELLDLAKELYSLNREITPVLWLDLKKRFEELLANKPLLDQAGVAIPQEFGLLGGSAKNSPQPPPSQE